MTIAVPTAVSASIDGQARVTGQQIDEVATASDEEKPTTVTIFELDFPDSITHRDGAYIGGQWVEAGGPETAIINPATEQACGWVAEATPDVVDSAVEAAAQAFGSWRKLSPTERAKQMAAVAAKLGERAEELANLTIAELGMPRPGSLDIQAQMPVSIFENIGGFVDSVTWEERLGNSVVYYDPIGVIAAITPWNFPMYQIAAKVAPAMVAGCTVVLKPSVLAPLTAYVLAEAVHEAGVAPGVFNLVVGSGDTVGERLVAHPKVAMTSFTGSLSGGRRVGEVAANGVQPVVLELGGKSPAIVLDDASDEMLAGAIEAAIFTCTMNAGQVCEAITRVLVPRPLLRRAEEIAIGAAKGIKLGDPRDDATTMGPVVSASQRDIVCEYIRSGIDEGARLLAGGPEAPEGFGAGYWVQPTVFSDVTPQMRIAREEIFGPVLVLVPYDGDDQEAVDIANSTEYGLAAAVWSSDPDRAARVARWVDSGQINVNGAPYDLLAPFGGFKNSGHGRESGRFGIEEYLVTRALQLPADESDSSIRLGLESL